LILVVVGSCRGTVENEWVADIFRFQIGKLRAAFIKEALGAFDRKQSPTGNHEMISNQAGPTISVPISAAVRSELVLANMEIVIAFAVKIVN
jgi:hypothetical protein